MFNLKDNVYNLKKLIKILENNTTTDNYNSIIDLICHQFYENISNPQNEEFLILVTTLLSDLINSMSSCKICSFLDNTYIHKILKSLEFSNRRQWAHTI